MNIPLEEKIGSLLAKLKKYGITVKINKELPTITSWGHSSVGFPESYEKAPDPILEIGTRYSKNYILYLLEEKLNYCEGHQSYLKSLEAANSMVEIIEKFNKENG